MPTNRRGRILIDSHVQGALLLRVGCYWLFCLLSITLMLICWEALTRPPQRYFDLFVDFYHRYAPAFAASLLLLPLVMIDVLRLSNRFVGPIVRLRGALRQLAGGESVKNVKFREGDFWPDLADDFNAATERLHADSAPEKSNAV